MRSEVRLPAGLRMFPQYLRDAGYYATNNSKEDYNLKKPGRVWDESSGRAHWKNRGDNQPFFAVFNHTISHESQIRNALDPRDRIHDPARVRIPPYHPDTAEVRQDWAQYHDRISMMDAQAGGNLKELERARLDDDTIVFYFSDHGSGMPRSKRFLYNSGLNVPLIVYFPEKWRHLAPDDYRPGGKSDRLVSFVDLAPTVLSLAGIEPPKWMQGGALAGVHRAGEPEFSYGFRGRMDERYDMMRAVRDKRFLYIRNYMPHRIYGQHVSYMFQTPTTRVWHELYREGKLDPVQARFWQKGGSDARCSRSMGRPHSRPRFSFRMGDARAIPGRRTLRDGARPGAVQLRSDLRGGQPGDFARSERLARRRAAAGASRQRRSLLGGGWPFGTRRCRRASGA
jgi:uncharacterized sulfatase